MTFKLAPRVAIALEKAKDMTGKGKSELVEAALIAYLHLWGIQLRVTNR
jgi:hypothetical protein